MSEIREPYHAQDIDPEVFGSVTIGITPKWHKILLRLQQLEKAGARMGIVQFTRRGPIVLEVKVVE